MPREYDRDRLERLSLYIASRSANDPKFGKTKLAKILFFIFAIMAIVSFVISLVRKN